MMYEANTKPDYRFNSGAKSYAFGALRLRPQRQSTLGLGPREMNLPKVVKIWMADIYRDGGSYGFCFDSDDGNWYEFFLQTRAFETFATESHHPPVIYLEDVNSNNAVRNLSWEEAQAFIAPLYYESKRFDELVSIVVDAGKKVSE